ncbi:MAG TPA: hypothetical protein VGI95_03790 [Caulobacteraceae bacterium]|jgi:hypothetical protein
MNAESLARLVWEEIEGFQIPEESPQQLGSPLPPEWYARQLVEMRAALVEPYTVEMLDGRRPHEGVRPVWVVAQDAHILLAYDPDPEGDFVLIFMSAPQPGLSPVRGDAVGSFIAR